MVFLLSSLVIMKIWLFIFILVFFLGIRVFLLWVIIVIIVLLGRVNLLMVLCSVGDNFEIFIFISLCLFLVIFIIFSVFDFFILLFNIKFNLCVV